MVDLGRRAFFRGRPRPKAQIRPPWALPEPEFVAACTRCNACLQACPQHIVVAGDGAYPTIDFQQGECTFCGDCARACQPGALRHDTDGRPWPNVGHVGEACLPRRNVECRSCDDYCAANAIRFSPRLGACPLPEIDPDRCTGCGACVAPCPAQAITIRP